MMSVKQTVGQDPNKITALYERLSRDDDQVGDSNSIINQKKYLESYAEQKGYTNIQHYTDDGWSGGNFNRPAWKQLEADIEAGKVAHVIVKDMSRIGRDYLQTGFYTEVFFREHGAASTFFGRLVPAVRQLISIPAGLSGMHVGKFLLFTTIGAGVWNTVLAFIGWGIYHYTDYKTTNDVYQQALKYSHELGYIILALVAIVVAFLAYKGLKKNK